MRPQENLEQTSINISKVDAEPDLTLWLRSYTQKKTLLLVSGGSSASVAISAIKQLSTEELRHLTISLTDERYVPIGDSDSNWQQLLDLGLPIDNVQTIPALQDPGTDIDTTEHAWQENINRALQENSHVLAIFGVGADSHIAGLKPFSPLMRELANITGHYKAEDWQRISITPVFFSRITSAVVYAKGKNKRDAIELLPLDLDAETYPDQLIKQTQAFTVYYQTGGNA